MTSFSGSISRPYVYPRDPFRLDVGENVGHEARYYSNTAFNLLFEKRLMSPTHPVDSPINIYVNKESGLFYNIEPTINGSGYELGDISYSDYVEDMRGLLEDIAQLHSDNSDYTYGDYFSAHMNRIRQPYDLDNTSASGKSLFEYVNTNPLGHDIDMDELLWSPFARFGRRAYIDDFSDHYLLISPIFPSIVTPSGNFPNYNQATLDYLDNLGINAVSSGGFLIIGDQVPSGNITISSGLAYSGIYQLPFLSGINGDLEATFVAQEDYIYDPSDSRDIIRTSALLKLPGEQYFSTYYTIDDFGNLGAAVYTKPSDMFLPTGIYLLDMDGSGTLYNFDTYPKNYNGISGIYIHPLYNTTEYPGFVVDTKCIFDSEIGPELNNINPRDFYRGNNRINGTQSTFTRAKPLIDNFVSSSGTLLSNGININKTGVFGSSSNYMPPLYQTPSGAVMFIVESVHAVRSFINQSYPSGGNAAIINISDSSFENYKIDIVNTQHTDTLIDDAVEEDLGIKYWKRGNYVGYHSYPAISFSFQYGSITPITYGLSFSMSNVVDIDGYIAVGDFYTNLITNGSFDIDIEVYNSLGNRIEGDASYTPLTTYQHSISISGISNGFAIMNDTGKILTLCNVNGQPHLHATFTSGPSSGLYKLDATSIANIPSNFRARPIDISSLAPAWAGSGYQYDIVSYDTTASFIGLARQVNSSNMPVAMFGVAGYTDSFPIYNIALSNEIEQTLVNNNWLIDDFSTPVWDSELGINYTYMTAASGSHNMTFFCKMNTSYEIYEAVFIGGGDDLDIAPLLKNQIIGAGDTLVDSCLPDSRGIILDI